MIEFDFTTKRQVISGLEGSGKSSKTFQSFHKQNIATTQRPLLYACRSYKAMQEKVTDWSARFDIPLEQFAICGLNKEYDAPGRNYYTNVLTPEVIPNEARYVFVSQQLLMRSGHILLKKGRRRNLNFSCIIADECDYNSVVFPTRKYAISIQNNHFKRAYASWATEAYSRQDYDFACNSPRDFVTAYWISNSKCPLVFLTSETIPVLLLQAIGFQHTQLPSPDFSHCIVRTFSHKQITRGFIRAATSLNVWKQMNYDAIFVNYVSRWLPKDDPLNFVIDNHTNIRGSNKWANNDSNILVVLSQIGGNAVTHLQAIFRSFDCVLGGDQLVADLYGDILKQSLGRTLGHRGSTSADLIIRTDLLQAITNHGSFPYTFQPWTPDLDLYSVFSLANEFSGISPDRNVLVKSLFKVSPGNNLDYSSVKHILKSHNADFSSPKIVADILGCKVGLVGKSRKRCIINIDLL